MPSEREAAVRKRRWSIGDGRTPNRDRQCAEGPASLPVLLVWRLASNQRDSKSREATQI